MSCPLCKGSGEYEPHQEHLLGVTIERALALFAHIRVNREIEGCPLYALENSPEAQKALRDFERAMYVWEPG